MGFTVEKDWITKAGFRAVVTMGNIGHRCGYVGVPEGHLLYGTRYDQDTHALKALPEDEQIGNRGIMTVFLGNQAAGGMQRPDYVFDVHGSLTYAGGGKGSDYPVDSDLWWFGYDCGHSGDAPSPEYIETMSGNLRRLYENDQGDVHRDLAFCEEQCESLAQQLIDRVKDA